MHSPRGAHGPSRVEWAARVGRGAHDASVVAPERAHGGQAAEAAQRAVEAAEAGETHPRDDNGRAAVARAANGCERREGQCEEAEAQRLCGGEVLAVEGEPYHRDADKALGRRGGHAAHRVVVAAQRRHRDAPRVGPRRTEAVGAAREVARRALLDELDVAVGGCLEREAALRVPEQRRRRAQRPHRIEALARDRDE